jgi:hypothetical protein
VRKFHPEMSEAVSPKYTRAGALLAYSVGSVLLVAAAIAGIAATQYLLPKLGLSARMIQPIAYPV